MDDVGVRRDRGQAVLLVAIVVVFAGLLAFAAARAGAVVVDRQRAQGAADAAALAGIEGGQGGAAELAQRNGAQLVSYRRSGWEVTVVVERHGVRASARASNGP